MSNEIVKTFGPSAELSTLNEAYEFANVLMKSGMAPKGSSPESIMISVQMGYEVGLKPMQSVQNIAVINGRPSIWGDAVIGLVRGSGLLEDYNEEEVGTFPNDDYGIKCTTKRKGESSHQTSVFTIGDAKSAGLWNKSGPWKQYPKRMIKLRSRGFLCRDVYGDVLKGLNIAEEAHDMPKQKQESSAKQSLSALDPLSQQVKNDVVEVQAEVVESVITIEQVVKAVGLDVGVILTYQKSVEGDWNVKESLEELTQQQRAWMLENGDRAKNAIMNSLV